MATRRKEPTNTYRHRETGQEVKALQWNGENAEAISTLCGPKAFATNPNAGDKIAEVLNPKTKAVSHIQDTDWVISTGDSLETCFNSTFQDSYEES